MTSIIQGEDWQNTKLKEYIKGTCTKTQREVCTITYYRDKPRFFTRAWLAVVLTEHEWKTIGKTMGWK